MSGLQPRRASDEPDQFSLPIDLPRYPTPAGGGGIAWAVPEPRPVSRRRLVAGSLASQVAVPFAKVVAVGSGAGWVVAAGIFVWTLASGRAVSVVTGARPVAETALAVIDLGIGLVALIRGSSQSDRTARTARRSRRSRAATGTPIRRLLHVFLMPSATASMPRRLRGLLVAGIWTSVLAGTWQVVAWPAAIAAGDGAAQDQRFAASVWMMHLIAWCFLACRRLTRPRANSTGWL